jgi:PleD family two-component response regulator
MHTEFFPGRFLQQAAAARTTIPRRGSLTGIRVLVVDDNATNREILTRQLAHWQMDVLTAESGAAALEILETAAQGDTTLERWCWSRKCRRCLSKPLRASELVVALERAGAA